MTTWLNPAAITAPTIALAAAGSSPPNITWVERITATGSLPTASHCWSRTRLRSASNDAGMRRAWHVPDVGVLGDALSRQFVRALQILASPRPE